MVEFRAGHPGDVYKLAKEYMDSLDTEPLGYGLSEEGVDFIARVFISI